MFYKCIDLTGFNDSSRYFFIAFEYFNSFAKPSCLTFVWYSGPVVGLPEEELEVAVEEPQGLVEWRPDDVI